MQSIKCNKIHCWCGFKVEKGRSVNWAMKNILLLLFLNFSFIQAQNFSFSGDTIFTGFNFLKRKNNQYELIFNEVFEGKLKNMVVFKMNDIKKELVYHNYILPTKFEKIASYDYQIFDTSYKFNSIIVTEILFKDTVEAFSYSKKLKGASNSSFIPEIMPGSSISIAVRKGYSVIVFTLCDETKIEYEMPDGEKVYLYRFFKLNAKISTYFEDIIKYLKVNTSQIIEP